MLPGRSLTQDQEIGCAGCIDLMDQDQDHSAYACTGKMSGPSATQKSISLPAVPTWLTSRADRAPQLIGSKARYNFSGGQRHHSPRCASTAQEGPLTDPKTIEISCEEVWQEVSNYIDGEVNAELRERMRLHFQG